MPNPGQARSASTRAARNALVLQQFREVAKSAGVGETSREWLALHAPFGALAELIRAIDPSAFVNARGMTPRRKRRSF